MTQEVSISFVWALRFKEGEFLLFSVLSFLVLFFNYFLLVCAFLINKEKKWLKVSFILNLIFKINLYLSLLFVFWAICIKGLVIHLIYSLIYISKVELISQLQIWFMILLAIVIILLLILTTYQVSTKKVHYKSFEQIYFWILPILCLGFSIFCYHLYICHLNSEKLPFGVSRHNLNTLSFSSLSVIWGNTIIPFLALVSFLQLFSCNNFSLNFVDFFYKEKGQFKKIKFLFFLIYLIIPLFMFLIKIYSSFFLDRSLEFDFLDSLDLDLLDHLTNY